MRGARAAAGLALLGALQGGVGPSAEPAADAVADSNAASRRWLLGTPAVRPGEDRSLVELLADDDGVLAFRTGLTHAGAGGSVTWDPPAGDAVALDGSWWTLARTVKPAVPPTPEPGSLSPLGVDVVAATVGDPDDDGTDEVVVVFRRPFRETVVSGLLPEVVQLDDAGRSLHLGLYGPDLAQEWVAGTLFRPVAAVAACDGALALGYASSVATADRVGAGASLWGGFGFTSLPGLPDLPGAGDPACADVNGDGRTEPVVINRTPEERTTP